MKVNMKQNLMEASRQALTKAENELTKLINDDGLDTTLVTEDGVRIGDAFYYCDHDALGGYYLGTWAAAEAGDCDATDDDECTVLDVLQAHANHQGAELSMMMRETPEAVQTAVQAYWDNKRDNSGFCHYDTLEEFAKVFNPLADELMYQKHLVFGSKGFTQLQSICIDLFEYGDCKWTGQVYESGVPSMVGR